MRKKMKKSNPSPKGAKRQKKNLKRIAKKNSSGHYLDKYVRKQMASAADSLTPEQRANAERALAESVGIAPEELAVVEPWSVKDE
jgi:hypothetical protein